MPAVKKSTPRFLSTPQVAKALKVKTHHLRYLIDTGRLTPVRGPRNAFLWAKKDIRKAERLIKSRARRWSGVRYAT